MSTSVMAFPDHRSEEFSPQTFAGMRFFAMLPFEQQRDLCAAINDPEAVALMQGIVREKARRMRLKAVRLLAKAGSTRGPAQGPSR